MSVHQINDHITLMVLAQAHPMSVCMVQHNAPNRRSYWLHTKCAGKVAASNDTWLIHLYEVAPAECDARCILCAQALK